MNLAALNPFRAEEKPLHTEFASSDIPKYTPDIMYLERRPYHLVFACDETMKAWPKHNLLGEEKVETKVHAFTHSKFTLVKKNLGLLSSVIPLKLRLQAVPWARIRGELYAVKTKDLIELDNYKLNGVEFQRYRINLLIPYRRIASEWWAKEKALFEDAVSKTPFWDDTLKAWLYVGKSEHWEDLLTKNWEADRDLRRFGKTYRFDDDGKLRAILKNNFYSPVKDFQPNNERLERYYYYSRFWER